MVRPSPTRTGERGAFSSSFTQSIDQPFHQTMYRGVLRDDERRREKMLRREEDLQESRRKREIYERIQQVHRTDDG